MNALEARKKYFERYVEFEHLVRRVAIKFIINYTSKDKTLNDVIMAIGANSILNSKDDGVNSKELLKHKNTRNWLSHSPKNTLFEGKNKINANDIDNVITKLKVIIKK